jgi:hypothetical protein
MKMRQVNKFKVIVFLLLILLINVKAQNYKSFSLGLKTSWGETLTNDVGDMGSLGYNKAGMDTYLIGLSANYALKSWFSLGVDWLLNGRGASYKSVNSNVVMITSSSGGTSIENVYYYWQNRIVSFDFPMYVKFGFYDEKYYPFLKLGLNTSIVLNRFVKYNQWTGTKETWREKSIRNEGDRYSPGIFGAFGFTINRVVLELQYLYYYKTYLAFPNSSNKVDTYSILFGFSYLLTHRTKEGS